MERFTPIIRFVLDGLLVAVIGVLLARLVWLVFSPEYALAPSEIVGSTRATLTSARPGLVVDQTVLTQSNPFAANAGLAVEPEQIVEDAPETRLNLKLVGLRAAPGGASSTAYIITPDNRQALYHEGDQVLSGVTVDRILPDRVLLEKNGELESLLARSDTLIFTMGETREPSELGPSVVAVDGDGAATASSAQAPTSPPAPVSGRTLLRSIALAPVRDGGRTVGLRLVPRGDPMVMAAAGLKPGDVLLAVNGRSVTNVRPEEVRELLQEVRDLELDIERSGERQAVVISFSEESQ